ncbi:CKLF-like MARVEL transmembrane domain-containing protein 8 isoform X1 [Macrosteles quadrilineatus]|uniref:CKLF-like MARVEL transmembrane domain-containing protein 8 isoform X1 n=1 Tax=Macrosteles quadrilineatus TaxID=74068 RepID=UPI0023E2C7A8|nr:CKLF-like MARVEL transmembrane domain-containing protein 8 isoform X1 [Macrosteles quadrilineatus]XP_054268571.1 CKLF-like MARVEL transmembrane domain-containing protein 8 isoform X1 [Macrosteles quadrilineatus]
MSHTVTVTRTTTSTTTSAIILNTGYCKTAPGLLKIAEVIIGLVIFILMNIYSDYFYLYSRGFTEHMYLFLVVFACLVSSTCLFLSCLFSLSTSSIISKTLYEFTYHGVAFLLYLVTMILYFVKDRNNRNTHHPNSTVGVLGLIMVVLYLASTILAYRSYRGP